MKAIFSLFLFILTQFDAFANAPVVGFDFYVPTIGVTIQKSDEPVEVRNGMAVDRVTGQDIQQYGTTKNTIINPTIKSIIDQQKLPQIEYNPSKNDAKIEIKKDKVETKEDEKVKIEKDKEDHTNELIQEYNNSEQNTSIVNPISNNTNPQKPTKADINLVKKNDNIMEQHTQEPIVIQQGPNNVTSSKPKKRVVRVNTITKKQREAKKMDLPDIEFDYRINWENQILPPNIGQKVYIEQNEHLVPVTFQHEIDMEAFKHISNQYDVYILRALLNKVSNIDIQDQYGNTLLMYSIACFNRSAMVLLINLGANPNKANDVGISPLHLAAYLSDDVAIATILQAGANVNIVDQNGNTPIMYAAAFENAQRGILDRFIEHGADLNVRNNKDLTVMDFAKVDRSNATLEYIRTKVLQESDIENLLNHIH